MFNRFERIVNESKLRYVCVNWFLDIQLLHQIFFAEKYHNDYYLFSVMTESLNLVKLKNWWSLSTLREVPDDYCLIETVILFAYDYFHNKEESFHIFYAPFSVNWLYRTKKFTMKSRKPPSLWTKTVWNKQPTSVPLVRATTLTWLNSVLKFRGNWQRILDHKIRQVTINLSFKYCLLWHFLM